MTRALFSVGTARGGTGLLTRMLSVGPQAEIALDPYLDLYRSLRTAIIKNSDDQKIISKYNESDPLIDYYYSQDRVDQLQLIQASNLEVPVDASKREQMLANLKKRAQLSSGDLCDHMDQIQGNTFKELFDSALKLIETTRKSESAKWIGIHENWTVEYLLPLARSYPDAKFMIITRDPRAVIASNLKVAESERVGHVLSYARCLRKLMAFARYYPTLEIFKNRLMVVRYEDLVLQPERECRKLCNFLGMEYSPDMLDTNNYIEPSNGAVYNGFSNYEQSADGISEHRIHRWKKNLDPKYASLVDLVAGPEMKLFGYDPFNYKAKREEDVMAMKGLTDDNDGPKSWRCDAQDPELDFQRELERRLIIQNDRNISNARKREYFLYPEVLEQLKNKNANANKYKNAEIEH